MFNPETIKTENVPDRIKQTLKSSCVPIYDWMFDIGLHQCDLLVYAAFFDELRHEPLTPKNIKLTDIANRIHYSVPSVCNSLNMLVEHNILFRQGERSFTKFSIYPFDTLDLK